jgi:putative tricarboxylic transport membrane protein
MPRENVEFWQGVFAKLAQTASWKRYVAENQLEEGYQPSAELARFLDEVTDRMRGVLGDAGVRTVR